MDTYAILEQLFTLANDVLVEQETYYYYYLLGNQ